MSRHAFTKDLDTLRRNYAQRLALFGDTAQGVQWRDRRSQERRMAVLAEVGDLRKAKILDLGCGTGHLYVFLREHLDLQGEYVGYDITPEMVAAAQKKLPDVRIENRDILAEGIPENFDYVLINGIFNNRIRDNWEYMTSLLREAAYHARKAVAFNCLSSYDPSPDRSLYYAAPEDVFRFCIEELSPCVILRNDYQVRSRFAAFEFTVYVYQKDLYIET
jgi:SAM-dependent methyltransferase